MNELHVDVAIIGAGTAGLNARRAALRGGARSVVMIEDGPYGTTCARVGCMPSKLLIAAADAAYEIRHAELFGVHAPGGARVDGQAVLERVRRERDRFVGFVLSDVEEIPAEQKVRGTARFSGPTTLVVRPEAGGDALQVTARAVVIATGSMPWHPPILGELGDRLLRNDDVFELETIPSSVAVVGAGIIGLELGQALHRLGARTSFFSLLSELGPATDPAIQAKARAVLEKELELHLPVELTAARRVEQGVELEWSEGGEARTAKFEFVVSATGRIPRLKGLGLETTGIALTEKGVPLFDPHTMQCGSAPIFIAGDATNDRPLLHEASDEGHLAGGNAARFPEVERGLRRTPLAVVFIDPGMAMCGASYKELQTAGVDFAIGEVSFESQGRSRIMGRNAGLARFYGDRSSGRLLGVELFGPRVEHTAHLLAWAIQAEMTVDRTLEMPFYHPVIEEGIRSGLRSLQAALRG